MGELLLVQISFYFIGFVAVFLLMMNITDTTFVSYEPKFTYIIVELGPNLTVTQEIYVKLKLN